MTYKLTGVTYNNIGTPLGSCDVFLLKYDSGTDQLDFVDFTTSNGSTGVYTFTGIADNDAAYAVASFKDGSPNVFDITDRNLVPIDETAPTVSSFSPLDNAVDVVATSNLVVTFNENVQFGATVAIALKKSSDDSVVESWDEGDINSGISITGAALTINPASSMASNTGHYVTISAGSIEDLTDNAYAGISAKTTWNFTTEDVGGGTIPGDYTHRYVMDDASVTGGHITNSSGLEGADTANLIIHGGVTSAGSGGVDGRLFDGASGTYTVVDPDGSTFFFPTDMNALPWSFSFVTDLSDNESSSSGSRQTWMCNNRAGFVGLRICQDAGTSPGRVVAAFVDGSAGVMTDSSVIAENTRTSVIVTHDGAGDVNIYINGTAQGLVAGSGGAGGFGAFVGAIDTASGTIIGKMDDLIVYNRELDASECAGIADFYGL